MNKILIIEDDPRVRDNLFDILEAEHYEVIEAEDGEIGIKQAIEHLPDLIISDIMMPNLDGYAVLEELRANSSTSAIPFIFLTAKADQKDLRKGMTFGAADYLTKPFTQSELVEVVKTRLELKSKVETAYERVFQNLRDNIALALPHELRTPLSPILALACIMRDEPESISVVEIQQYGDMIYNGAQRLSSLIENYISFVRFELISKNPDELERIISQETLNTDEVIKEVISTYFSNKEHRYKDFEYKLDSAITRISASYLQKIIHEILDNACKFSRPDTPIRLRGKNRHDHYEIIIRDQGRGMTPLQLKQVGAYMQFERAHYEQQGMGLGLIIVKRIVEIHGGEIDIKSKVNQGTMITIRLGIKESN